MKKQTGISKGRRIRAGQALWKRGRLIAVLGLFGFGVAVLDAAVLKIELPHETASFKPAPEVGMANAQCLTCHSVEYVQTQPPMPLAFWSAEVKKMRDKFGAPVPDDQIEPLAHYLAENYGTGANNQAPAAENANPTNALANAEPINVQALATRFGCLSCHGINVKIVGPAYHDVALKYRNDPEAYEKIAAQIHHGGSGKWGSVLMPPFPMVTDAQARMLAEWILSQAGPAK
jgi:cytochrome c551/c552